MLRVLCLIALFVTPALAAAPDARAIDWKNLALEGDIQLTEGLWSLELEPGVHETVALEETRYVDLTGDGAEEAVLLTTYYTDDAPPISTLYVYAVRDGQPRLLRQLDSDALILSVDVHDGAMRYVERDGLLVSNQTWRPRLLPDASKAVAQRAAP
jgi:hypothetical protein